jgi:hypothetical protein
MPSGETGRWVLYTRRGCHLCEQTEDWLAALGFSPTSHAGHFVDVDGDASLQRLHGHRVPVLAVDGVVLLEGRFTEADLVRAAGRLVTAPASGRGDPARRSAPPPS